MAGRRRGGGEEEGKGKSVLDEPRGWRKDRHSSYATTDLNLVTDHFTQQDRAWLRDILNARLGPTIQRVYGITPSAIRANDVSSSRSHLLHARRRIRVGFLCRLHCDGGTEGRADR